MTSILSQLLEMKSVKDADVWLYCTKWKSGEWTCAFEIESKDLKLRIERRGETPDAAVATCYDAWRALQKGVPDAAPSLLVAPNDADILDAVPF